MAGFCDLASEGLGFDSLVGCVTLDKFLLRPDLVSISQIKSVCQGFGLGGFSREDQGGRKMGRKKGAGCALAKQSTLFCHGVGISHSP